MESISAERPDVTAATTSMPRVMSSLVSMRPAVSMANMADDRKISVP